VVVYEIMASERIKGTPTSINGEIALPGDKSISHRAVILGSLADGVTNVEGFLKSEDTFSTISAMKLLGADIGWQDEILKIKGSGLHGLKEPEDVIDAGNSGTTSRLLIGLLSAQNFSSTITGDKYLQKRPMDRVIKPLRKMGAQIQAKDDSKLPVSIEGTRLTGISYKMPVASAQVKSSILLAGLFAEGQTEVIEPAATRDHTEIMMKYLGIDLSVKGNSIKISKSDGFDSADISIPSDFSTAAFFIVAALINPDSEILIKNVGINPYRTGALEILKAMGGNIELINKRHVSGEPVADIVAKSSLLSAVKIGGDMIPKAIDELPIIAVAACFADGTTTITDAGELRVKETDRIKATVCELKNLGADIEELSDGMKIEGREQLTGSECTSWGDHRIAMSVAIAATRAKGQTMIEDSDAVAVSYPQFFETLREIR
jgi:3-phosphoshikimate 1-carboxyvinyltransferase